MAILTYYPTYHSTNIMIFSSSQENYVKEKEEQNKK